MTSEAPGATGSFDRLHPLSLLFSLGTAAKRLLLPGLVVLVASRGNRAEIWLMLLFVPAVLGALVRYASFRYRLGREEMVVREGLLRRNERHIPYARIQNIDLVQNPLHRLLGVAEVRVETASGQKPEAVMRVLALEAVERMRTRALDDGPPAAAAGEPAEERRAAAPRELVRLPLRELLLLGLLSNRGLALIAAALGVLSQSGLFDFEERLGQLSGRLGSDPFQGALALPQMSSPLVVAGLVVIALLVIKALSGLWVVLRFHGFSLTRRGDDLRSEYGLLTRVSATIPRHRIQLLTVRTSPLSRWLDRATVQVETAGSREEGEGSIADRLWLAPLLPRGKVAPLLAEVLAEPPAREPRWNPIPPRARSRVFKRAALPALLVSGLAALAVWPWGLALLPPGLLLAWTHARLYVRHAAWAVDGSTVLYRSGWWVQRSSLVHFGKIQVLGLRESPFDRRRAMATVHVDTAGAGRTGHRVEIRYLESGRARDLVELLATEAGRVEFRW